MWSIEQGMQFARVLGPLFFIAFVFGLVVKLQTRHSARYDGVVLGRYSAGPVRHVLPH